MRPTAAGAASASCSTNASRSVTACASAPRDNRPMIEIKGEIKELGERIDALEARVAYQDDTIETLNQTITAQWQTIDTLARQLNQLSERLKDAEAGSMRPSNEPPPHY